MYSYVYIYIYMYMVIFTVNIVFFHKLLYVDLRVSNWLVVWNMFFSIQLEMASSQLTISYVFRGVGQPPTSLYIGGRKVTFH